MPENLINALEPYNEICGYKIESVIAAQGYTVTGEKSSDTMTMFELSNSNGNKGALIISEHISPVFYEEGIDGKRNTVIIFGKTLQMTEYVRIPGKELGAVELGIDVDHPDYMEFYSTAKLRFRYLEDPKHELGVVLPDEIRPLTRQNVDAVSAISQVKLWSSEIRRNLAPQHDLTAK